jgi:hypothetical protein
MLKKSASIVLASFRGSTYRSVRLASSLAAALPDGPFEHPEAFGVVAPSIYFNGVLCVPQVVPQSVKSSRKQDLSLPHISARSIAENETFIERWQPRLP